MKEPYFMKYQEDWLNDKSAVKVWEKSRRIGATYVQSYEDVVDMLNGKYPSVWFSSADDSAAVEYILYCKKWVEMFSTAAPNELVLGEKHSSKSHSLLFANGSRITALSSNPKSFRSKGGKVVLDEFAHHLNAFELWKAAKPVSSWGFPIRILSTHNGKQSLFYKFVEESKSPDSAWSLHKTTIHDAVNDGLVNAVLGKTSDTGERNAWLDELRKGCFDDAVWNEEYCCIPVDETTAFISYDLINSCTDSNLPLLNKVNTSDQLYAGIDIGRKNDLTVIYILKKVENIFVTFGIRILKNESFQRQKEFIYDILSLRQLKRCAIDCTGLGMQLAEDARNDFGAHKVENITFTPKRKEELAYFLKRSFENRSVILPLEPELKDDLHSVRRVSSSNGAIRFVADRSTGGSHADRFWALALALSATNNESIIVPPQSRFVRHKSKVLKGFV